MNPLDNKSILALRKALKPADKSEPYALVFDDHVMVTNHSFLMVWPLDLVDQECSRFSKLLDNEKQQEYQSAGRRLKAEGWRALLLDGAKFAKVEEMEPEEDDIDSGQIVYAYRKKRIEYGIFNFDAVELFVADPDYRLIIPPRDASSPPAFKPMVIFDGRHEVGVFMNDFPRNR